jgi:hypothetical protein
MGARPQRRLMNPITLGRNARLPRQSHKYDRLNLPPLNRARFCSKKSLSHQGLARDIELRQAWSVGLSLPHAFESQR